MYLRSSAGFLKGLLKNYSGTDPPCFTAKGEGVMAMLSHDYIAFELFGKFFREFWVYGLVGCCDWEFPQSNKIMDTEIKICLFCFVDRLFFFFF